ncbi:MAG: aerolysin family beta-barrel pore-forming toxin [Shewanella sp.]|nr:aerolysin family beta-barrel pore-forming toxin [Shewanella sp.]
MSKANIVHMSIFITPIVVALVSTALQAKQIDILDVELVNGSCMEGYQAVTPDEAGYIKPELLSQMDRFQITNLSDGWVIIGSFYGGRIEKYSRRASTTWCKNLNPSSHDIPNYEALFLEEGDESTVEWSLVNNKTFYQPLAEFANILGYAWPGGADSEFVGENMITWVNGERSYRIDGDVSTWCLGYRCDERLKMEVSDFEYQIDPGTFEHGDVTQTDSELVGQRSEVITNESNSQKRYRVTLKYTKFSKWSKNDTYCFTKRVAAKSAFKWPLVGATNILIEIGANQTWSDLIGKDERKSVETTVVITVAPHTKQEVLLDVFRASISYPYSFNAEVSYDLSLTNFMRRENALIWHPTDSPNYYTGRWVIGRNTDRHTDLGYQYSHRNIPTPDKAWDWPWVIRNYGEESTLMTMGRVLRKIYLPITGNFYAEASYGLELYLGKTIHLLVGKLSSAKSLQIDKELKQNSLTNEELEQNGIYNFSFEANPIANVELGEDRAGSYLKLAQIACNFDAYS